MHVKRHRNAFFPRAECAANIKDLHNSTIGCANVAKKMHAEVQRKAAHRFIKKSIWLIDRNQADFDDHSLELWIHFQPPHIVTHCKRTREEKKARDETRREKINTWIWWKKKVLLVITIKKRRQARHEARRSSTRLINSHFMYLTICFDNSSFRNGLVRSTMKQLCFMANETTSNCIFRHRNRLHVFAIWCCNSR